MDTDNGNGEQPSLKGKHEHQKIVGFYITEFRTDTVFTDDKF